MPIHLIPFATAHQTQGGNCWHHQEWLLWIIKCSPTSSHNSKLVWMCSEPRPHLLLGNFSRLLPAAGEQLIPASLWCAPAQPLPMRARSPCSLCSLGVSTAPDFQTAASRCLYWGQCIETGKWQNLRQKIPQFCHKKLSKEVQEWRKWKTQKPERATKMLL